MYEIKQPLENRNGILYIGGVSTLDIVEAYDTPLYVYDENTIRNQYRKLVDSFSKHYPNFSCFYAIKVNNNLAILRILEQEGAGIDCSSPGDIFLGKKAGFAKEKMLYSGVSPRYMELKYAVESEVNINLNETSSLDCLYSIYEKTGKSPEFISFRINPGIGKGNVAGNVLAGKDAKFGINEDEAIFAYKKAKDYGCSKFGIHMMTGSCILEPQYFEDITSKLLDICGNIKNELGINFEFIDIGGGFGVTYKPGEKDLDLEQTTKMISDVFSDKVKRYELAEPELRIEPGRYIVCESGILLTKVTSVKKGAKTFIGVDAGMNTLLRPALYDAYHEIFVASQLRLHEKGESFEKVNVAGPICENTDHFAKDRLLPKVYGGETLAILNAGAYGFSMGSQYNSRPMCAEVLVNGGKHELIRKRQDVSDIARDMLIPSHLKP